MCILILTLSIYLQSLENFSGQTTLIAHHLEMFMRQIHDTEFPNSVEATEKLLIEQSAEYNKLKVSEQHGLIHAEFKRLNLPFSHYRRKFCRWGGKEKSCLRKSEGKLKCVSIALATLAVLNGKSILFAFRFNLHS